MNAVDILNKQRHAAQYLSVPSSNGSQHLNFAFCVRLCEELLCAINPEATLNDAQANFVAVTVGNIGYYFTPGHDVKYLESSKVCPLLVLQLATYINSCK